MAKLTLVESKKPEGSESPASPYRGPWRIVPGTSVRTFRVAMRNMPAAIELALYTALDDRSLDHDCEYCNALPGEQCVTITGLDPGSVTAIHSGREKAGLADLLEEGWEPPAHLVAAEVCPHCGR